MAQQLKRRTNISGVNVIVGKEVQAVVL